MEWMKGGSRTGVNGAEWSIVEGVGVRLDGEMLNCAPIDVGL